MVAMRPQGLETLGIVAGGAALAAALSGHALAPLARRFGLVDRPGGRKRHVGEIPLVGGFVLLAGGAAAAALAPHAVVAALPPLVLAGAALAFATGLVDDLDKERLPWWGKLGGQFAAAALAAAGGTRADLLVWPALNVGASVLWIVLVCNAFNLIDHADGVAAGLGTIAAAALCAVATALGQPQAAFTLAALGGAGLGVLWHNAPPARLFLGDAGAHLLGYLLGVLTLRLVYVGEASPGLLPVALPVLVLGLPLADMGYVAWARLRSGRSVVRGDRNHLHHRLRRLGMSERQATTTVWLAGLSTASGAVALPFVPPGAAAAILLQGLATLALIGALMAFGERGESGGGN
ncbi:MAG: undecaprenyl/decaprenyl-phosphate alpha-N-acetylglucosaminyl 1-phosphate transferase [Planctomycetota bacterium]|nr:MAG: undecaprenyl/decaprenyl-phosphate alpha-N-acetylglucosaminyl 1-phosphate transferase [Planctomycetota bacterium]